MSKGCNFSLDGEEEKRRADNMRAVDPTTLIKRAQAKATYFLKTGYWHTGERVNPDFPDENFRNHLKVYRFARQFAEGRDVLDVGCGTGYGTAHLAQFARSIIGIDISASAIRLAGRKYGSGRFAVMDAQWLEFEKASFDFVLAGLFTHS